MDEATEPLIAVIGHPIAGHPAQFALERAFAHLGFDYRVASFDVSPENLGKALDGIDVLRFRGAYLDGSLREAASAWYRTRTDVESTDDSPPEPDTDIGPEAVATQPSGNAQDVPDSPVASSILASLLGKEPTAQKDSIIDPEERESFGDTFRWLSLSVDCLARPAEADLPLVASGQEQQALIQRIKAHYQEQNRSLQSVLVLGERSTRSDFPPSPERLEAADLIVIPDDESDPSAGIGSARSRSSRQTGFPSRPLAIDQWPAGDQLVVDLRRPRDSMHDEAAHQALSDRGYTVLSSRQQFIGGLAGCIRQWTDCEIAEEILADAIEEYTAV